MTQSDPISTTERVQSARSARAARIRGDLSTKLWIGVWGSVIANAVLLTVQGGFEFTATNLILAGCAVVLFGLIFWARACSER